MTWTDQDAQDFLDHQRPFRLGALLTEQPHPRTRRLSATLQRNTPEGVAMLLGVDRDIPPAARRVFGTSQFARLVGELVRAWRIGRRVFFTGCGATGRLAILMEACWRTFWRRAAGACPLPADLAAMGGRVVSVMAGGDFALIRSVEGFEDFAGFGRHQLRQAGVSAGDVVVAVTEGGETSFVIGTAWEGLDAGASVFFVFNNPAETLAATVVRSAEAIAEPRITKLDLHTGPMAVAGSTRMQATTVELLVLAAAMEQALHALLADRLAPADLHRMELAPRTGEDYAAAFERLLDQLASPPAVAAIAGMVELEEGIYRAGGLVTYLADDYLLDIFTDTTERSPTFALPPFRACDDTASKTSWAFVKDPLRPTRRAWDRLLARPPRGLDWDRQVYRRLDAPNRLVDDPPDLSSARIRKFLVGCEDDPSRYGASPNLAVTIRCGRGGADRTPPTGQADDAEALAAALARLSGPFERRAALCIGPTARAAGPSAGDGGQGVQAQLCFHVPCDLGSSPLDLWAHLAIKLTLNTLSTATMGRLGRIAGNWMIYVTPGNKKLIDRGTRLVAQLAGLDYDQACRELFATVRLLQQDPRAFGTAPSPAAATVERLVGPQWRTR